MTQKQKLINIFLKNPCSCRYRDVVVALEHFVFVEIKAKGSHVKFKHPLLPSDLIIPFHNSECKDFYKKEAHKKIKLILNS
ncbi:MAG: type II toxin-antitoxin system HicA family toxin [Candidatus Paceibacteria bacterium]